jgi:hypothetical protein
MVNTGFLGSEVETWNHSALVIDATQPEKGSCSVFRTNAGGDGIM